MPRPPTLLSAAPPIEGAPSHSQRPAEGTAVGRGAKRGDGHDRRPLHQLTPRTYLLRVISCPPPPYPPPCPPCRHKQVTLAYAPRKTGPSCPSSGKKSRVCVCVCAPAQPGQGQWPSLALPAAGHHATLPGPEPEARVRRGRATKPSRVARGNGPPQPRPGHGLLPGASVVVFIIPR